VIRLEHADRRSLLVALQALSRLVRTSGPLDPAAVLADAVRELGGTTAPATSAGPEALPYDLSCGRGEPLLAVAPPGSRARTRLEQVLPAMVEDARVVAAWAGHDRRLAEQADLDWLTGLLNRRGMDRLVRRLGPGDCVAVLDLDHFKSLNDSEGHAAGDEVLAALGRLLREQGRAGDRFGRMGGEEFLAVFLETDLDQAQHVLRRLRAAWSETAPHPVTFSVGLAAVGASGLHAVAAADEALYAAKAAGRDCLRVAVPRLPAPRAAAEPVIGRRAPERWAELGRATLLSQLATGDAQGAIELVQGLMDGGVSLSEVVVELLAPAQREVGRRWQAGAWSVADEHVATGVVDAVLAAATFRARGSAAVDAAAPPVVVVCPDGEWHQVPARMAAALLGELGIDVTQLGPSLPTRDLVRALRGGRYVSVVLSCTLITSLVAAGQVVRAAHEAGLPVVAGGAAFGPDSRRAAALGVDAWAGSAEAAAALIRSWAQSPPQLPAASAVPVARSLARSLGAAGREAVVTRVLAARPELFTPTPAAVEATREDIGHILEHLDAALTVQDGEVFFGLTDGLVEVFTARGLPVAAVTVGYRAIEEAVLPLDEAAAGLLREARSRLSRPMAAASET
jgi:diguanylate cyclase (GGDEF)-like protein